MHVLGRIRFTLAATMMFVLTTAAASALYVKILRRTEALGSTTVWKYDAPTLFLLGIILTALAPGAGRHTPRCRSCFR